MDRSACLYTVSQVSLALQGSWTRTHSDANGSCLYRSDRGAVLVASPVDESDGDLEAALADARVHCAAPINTPHGTKGSFVCFEKHADGNVVVGNLIAHGRLWEVIALAGSDAARTAEQQAIAALLNATR